jgi:FecR-like protein
MRPGGHGADPKQKRTKASLSRILFGVIFLLATAGSALAQEAGRVVSIVGTAEVFREGQWQPVSLGEALFPGQVVRTEPGSRMAIQLADESQLKVNANSQLVLKQVAPPTKRVAMGLMQTFLHLFSGEIWVRSLGQPLEIKTFRTYANCQPKYYI